MAKFNLTGSKTVAELKKEFNEAFGSNLKVYNKNRVAEDTVTLGELGLKADTEFECRSSRTAGSFIAAFAEMGLKVKVYTSDEWVAVLPGLTLEATGKVKKNATKADMEGMEGYQREEKDVEKEEASEESSDEPFKLLIDTYDITYKFEYDDTELYVKIGENSEILTSEEEEYDDEEAFEDTGKVVNEECYDVDELAVVIAKNIIKSSSNIRYTVYYCGELEFEDNEMTSDYELVKSDEMETLTLHSGGQSCLQLTIVEIEEDEVDDVREMINNEDADALADYMWDKDQDVLEVFNLWGDEDNETFDYKLEDEDGDVVDEGTILVKEDNVFDYGNYNRFADEYAPQYLLVRPDEIKKSWASFNIPKGANIKNVHFQKSAMFTFSGSTLGDTITSIGALHYAGLDLDNMDCGDNGTYGSESFILLKKMDGDNNWYDVVAEC